MCEKDPTLLGAHLRKCFEGVHALRFDQDAFVSHAISAEGEELLLQKISTKHAQISVENWLLEVLLLRLRPRDLAVGAP